MLFLAPKNEVFLKVTSLGDDYVMEFDNYQTEAIDDFQISDQMWYVYILDLSYHSSFVISWKMFILLFPWMLGDVSSWEGVDLKGPMLLSLISIDNNFAVESDNFHITEMQFSII